MIRKAAVFGVLFTFINLMGREVMANDVRIIEQTEHRLRLELSVDFPDVSTFGDPRQPVSLIEKSGWPVAVDEQGYVLPYRSILVHLNSDRAVVRLVSANEKRQKIDPPRTYEEKPLGSDDFGSVAAERDAVAENQIVTLTYVGQYSTNFLWSADVFPFKYDGKTGELITYAQIVFDVNIQDISVVTDWQPIPPAEIDALQRWGAISTTELQPNRLASSALSKKPTAVVEQWKILVNEEGIYQITGQDLANAGVDLLAIDFKKIRLVNNGRDVSLFPSGWRDGQFDPEDYIEFWGEPNRQTFQATAADMYQDPFSTERVYWLSWEKRGLWMAEESGEISDLQPGQYVRPYSFLETLHVEKDDYYDRLSAVPIDSLRDHWFFDSGVASGKKVDYEFVLDHPDTQSPLSVSARVMFSGRTTIVNIPHDVSVFLNDTFLFSNKWFGQELADLQTKADAPIISGELNDGVNRLSVVNNVLPQNYDFFMLNWFEITYPRLYRTSNDYIKFSIPPGMPAGKFLFRIDGFQNSEIDIYKLHQSKINGGMIEKVTDFNNFTSQQVSFQNDVFSPEVEFVAVAQNAKKKPFKIEKDNPTILKTTSLAADYLIITHRRFMKSASLQQLVSLRQSQGLQALVADVQDVYDEFNFGQPGSYAIKDFLKWAFDYWQAPRLRYVLLIGDGCYTRYTATGDTLDLVPVHMRQTMVYGAAASDFWYSLLTGDDEIPEVSIGRLPVRSEDELNRFVTKIVQYETNPPPGDWQNRLLIIGGNGGDFRSQGIALSKTIPLPFNTRMLFTVRDQSQEDPYFGGTSDLLDYFDLGCNVITFHGHGGGAIWADNGLLRFEDGNRIYTGGKSPFVLSMTCFTGSFESPGVESLADALLFSTFEGAIAMLGASGVGWTWNDYFLQTELMKQICAFPQLTLGEQLMAGKISYQVHYKTSQAVSQINQYHLLGDPATRLHLPQAVRPVIVDKTISLKGDTLTATCKLPFSRGEAVFDLEDSLRIVANSRTSAVIDSVATAKLFVSEDFAGKSGLVRFFGADETNRYKNHGAAPISLQGAVFDSAYVYRAQDDSLYFLAHVRSRNTIKSVWCYALNDSIIMNPIGDDWYRSSHAVFIIWSGFQFSYYFNAYDEANFRYTSRLYKHYINLNVDVEINENAVSLAGDEMVSLLASIQNKSSNPVNDLLVLFETRVLPDTTWRGAGVDTVSIEAFATTTCRVNYAPPPQDFLVRVTLDPDSTIREDSKQNNQMVQQITPHLFQVTPQGFYVQGQYQTTFRYDDYLSIELPVGAIPHYSAVLIEEMSALKINEQPDFYSPKVTPAYDLQLRSDYLLEKPAIVRLLLPHDSSITDSTRQLWKIFRFAKQTKKWVRCDTQLLENNLVTQLNVVGPLSVLVAQDSQSPDVFVSVDGQPYVDHKWAGDEPRIGIRLQDSNGIDLTEGKISIMLNGKPAPPEEVALPDSILDGNQIVISFNPQLTPGEQILTVQTTDCNQNISPEREFYLRIAEHFAIQMLGNYPNPFKDETRFAYLFTAPAEEMSLKIFTASGRLIRNITPNEIFDDANPLSADYHEVLWDGLDEEGYQVANGVYFYRLSATAVGKNYTIDGAIAKVK